jgi:cytochrome c biogenesis protein CcmG, thiol:disulfide interchange protein DsbE
LLIGSVIALALAAFLFVGLGTSSGPGPGSGPVVAIGDEAPTFTLASVTGGPPVNLAALGQHRHHPVVLNFFASWCTPCQKESPLLASTAHAEQAKGSTVQFIGVDVGEEPAQALPFLRQTGISYPVGSDTDYRVTSVVYGLNAQPNTFFIDASGHVVDHVIGAVSPSQLDQWVHRLAGSSG